MVSVRGSHHDKRVMLNRHLSEFTRTDEVAAVGAWATTESIEKWRSSLSHLDPRLFAEKFDRDRAPDIEQPQSLGEAISR